MLRCGKEVRKALGLYALLKVTSWASPADPYHPRTTPLARPHADARTTPSTRPHAAARTTPSTASQVVGLFLLWLAELFGYSAARWQFCNLLGKMECDCVCFLVHGVWFTVFGSRCLVHGVPWEFKWKQALTHRSVRRVRRRERVSADTRSLRVCGQHIPGSPALWSPLSLLTFPFEFVQAARFTAFRFVSRTRFFPCFLSFPCYFNVIKALDSAFVPQLPPSCNTLVFVSPLATNLYRL